MKDRTAKLARGLTLIEVLVVISILSIMCALLASAIFSARDAAHKANCTNNLRQIGLAMSNYATSHTVLPLGSNGSGYSSLTMILPQLEQTILYNSINFNINSFGFLALDSSATTAASTKVASFICPADNSGKASLGTTNYAGNGGYGSEPKSFNGVFIDQTIPIWDRVPITSASITDGTSNTAMMTEWITNDWLSNSSSSLSSVFDLPLSRVPRKSSFETFAKVCQTENSSNLLKNFNKPCSWIQGSFGNTLAHFSLLPFENSCTSSSAKAFTAASAHGGGVNVLFVDGHVGFIRQTVNINVWRAISTRNGGEVEIDRF